jgi:hypothetical protein
VLSSTASPITTPTIAASSRKIAAIIASKGVSVARCTSLPRVFSCVSLLFAAQDSGWPNGASGSRRV